MNADDLYVGTKYDSDYENDQEERMTDGKYDHAKYMEQRYKGIPLDILNIIRVELSVDMTFRGMTPESEYEQEFLNRPLALGLTDEQTARLRSAETEMGDKAKKICFKMLRSVMLKMMVYCDGASCLSQLVDCVEAERIGGLSQVPTWYVFTSKQLGPRRVGLSACDNKNCFRVETRTTRFSKCGGCSVPLYCSKDCQLEDWKKRHKYVCKSVNEKLSQMKAVAEMLEKFKDMENGDSKQRAELP